MKEFMLFVRAVGAGGFLLAVYDVLRILRIVFRHPGFLVAAEDILYWLFHAVYLFWMMYHQNNGAVRGYIVAGVILGMLVYNQTLSPVSVKWISGIFLHIRKIYEKVKNRLKKHVKHITIIVYGYFEEKAGKRDGEKNSEKTQ